MHFSGIGVVVCDVHVVNQDAVEFRCVLAKEVYLNSVMVPVPDLNTVVRVFIVGQDSPSCAVLLWDLFDDVTETFEEIISSATRVQYIILKIGVFF